MKKILSLFLMVVMVCTIVQAQTGSILPAQEDAIRVLAKRQGFTQKTLDDFLIDEYNVLIKQLTKKQAAELITWFQSENPPIAETSIHQEEEPIKKQPTDTDTKTISSTKDIQEIEPELILADVLEPGMEKHFHLVDDNIIYGKIIAVDKMNCAIQTNGDTLKIPKADILAESAIITKKDRTRFSGAVLSETLERIKLRTKYGDISIHKRDIREMDRFHGGKKTKMREDRHKFYRGEAQLINTLEDPTAFVLIPQTFYVSGMSVGYGFTDRFMLTTKFGSSFSGDLNIHPKISLYNKEDGVTEHGVTLGIGIHRRYKQRRLVGKYSQAIEEKSSGKALNNLNVDMDNVMVNSDDKALYNEIYLVYSKRRSLKSGRGKVGYSFGVKTNTLAWDKPELTDEYQWIDSQEFTVPFRAWFAFEYDLRKNLKFVSTIWLDNGNKSQTLRQSYQDYFTDNTPFIFDCHEGTYSIVDFDFGFLYAVNENLRIGLHFQDPFFEFYWEFFEF